MDRIRTVFLFVLTLLLMRPGIVVAADFEAELAGWRLQQFLALADTAFGEPFRTLDQPDGVLRAYRVGDDAYMVFGQGAVQPANIGSLQLTGTNAPGFLFKGLSLGDSESKVLAILGEPSGSIEVAEADTTRLSFGDSNYTVEIDRDGRLYSILLFTSQEFMASADDDFDARWLAFSDVLASGDAERLLPWLRPDVEVYKSGRILSIQQRYRDFAETPDPMLLDAFFSDDDGVRRHLSETEPEQNVRLSEVNGVGLVYKFPDTSALREIVLFPYAGEYRIYEVAFRDTTPNFPEKAAPSAQD
jgi:hypothetical protein